MKKQWAFPAIILLLLGASLIGKTGKPANDNSNCKSTACCSQKQKCCPGNSRELAAPERLPDNLSRQFLFISSF